MNRQPKITRREQQDFIRDEAVRMLHFAVRACPCNGVGCATCDGKMKYFDDPIPIKGAITSGMNSKKKEANFPILESGSYKLLVEARYRFVRGDRLKPFGMREFEQFDEVLSVEKAELTHTPINIRGVRISFQGPEGGNGVLDYKPGIDFTIEKEYFGRVPLLSKQITWITDPPTGQEKFSVRYGYYPDFEIEDTPPANLSESQLLIQQIPLKKITVGGQEKSKSYEKSSDAVRGVQSGLNYV